jgi:DNA mismatch repair protein MutL
MGNIIILDENTANKIAAGEVVERPASVIKELVENSIDAGAVSISVEIKNGGISLIKVSDNGCGMSEDDVEISFERHATSKIRNADDLDKISSMGFRGEALASIAAVSSVQLVTRTQGSQQGTRINITGGRVLEVKPTGCPAGTAITVRDLFFNTPARFKFLKKDTTEVGYVSDIISRIALGNPHISFKLTSNGTTVLHTPGNSDQLSAIFSIYGKEVSKAVNTIDYDDGRFKITGFAGRPELARSSRTYQSTYINRRFIKSKTIGSAIDEAYNTFLMKNKYAFIVLNIELNPVLVDVNVHPSKMEVKFSNEQDVFKAVYNALSNSLQQQTDIRTVQPEPRDRSVFKIDQEKYVPKADYTQVFIDEAEKKSADYETWDRGSAGEPNLGQSEVNEVQPVYTTPSQQDKKLLREARFIGQVFSTYILLQQENDLVLVDQHAAHERIMYEELKVRYENNEPMSQFLISPVSIELTFQEHEYLQEHSSFFNRIGFQYEGFGTNSVILRAIPTGRDTDNVRELFMDVLDFLMKNGRNKSSMPSDETLYMMACKAAVKANSALAESEVRTLLDRLSIVENPYTCPHGRPSAIKLRKYDLEKMFKRIV